jgi:hypothetical protein
VYECWTNLPDTRLALGLIALVATLAYAWRYLSASAMRLALAAMGLSLVAAIAGIAIDLAIPILAASSFLVLIRLSAARPTRNG